MEFKIDFPTFMYLVLLYMFHTDGRTLPSWGWILVTFLFLGLKVWDYNMEKAKEYEEIQRINSLVKKSNDAYNDPNFRL